MEKIENLTLEIENLINEVDIKKHELFDEYLRKTKEGFFKSDHFEDFNEYEEACMGEETYKALDLYVNTIDDFFDTAYHNTFVVEANREKEIFKMSEVEKDILSIAPSIEKCELFKIVKYINSKLEEE